MRYGVSWPGTVCHGPVQCLIAWYDVSWRNTVCHGVIQCVIVRYSVSCRGTVCHDAVVTDLIEHWFSYCRSSIRLYEVLDNNLSCVFMDCIQLFQLISAHNPPRPSICSVLIVLCVFAINDMCLLCSPLLSLYRLLWPMISLYYEVRNHSLQYTTVPYLCVGETNPERWLTFWQQ